MEVPFSTDFLIGDSLTIQQAGGVVTLASGEVARLVLEKDEPLIAGHKYLFFLTPSPADENVLVTSPFARLYMRADGSFEPISGWENMAAMHDLSDLNTEEAGAVVAGLSAE